VEDALVLDAAVLARAGHLKLGTVSLGRRQELRAAAGHRRAHLYLDADLRDPARARVVLCFYEGQRAFHQAIAVAVTKPHFGGARLWFMCPVTGRRVRCLYLPEATSGFASRAAHLLRYRSQSESALFRSISRVQKIRRRLGGNPSIHSRFPPRPRYMRESTYLRLRAEAEGIERAALQVLHQRDAAFQERWAEIEIRLLSPSLRSTA
jgi:hypothetical protein